MKTQSPEIDQIIYPTRYCIGYLDGKAIYAPLHAPTRGLAIEEDGYGLRAMREEEVLRFMAQIQSDFTAYLIAAQADELAFRQSEEWYSEIGHGKAYNWPHMPVVA